MNTPQVIYVIVIVLIAGYAVFRIHSNSPAPRSGGWSGAVAFGGLIGSSIMVLSLSIFIGIWLLR